MDLTEFYILPPELTLSAPARRSPPCPVKFYMVVHQSGNIAHACCVPGPNRVKQEKICVQRRWYSASACPGSCWPAWWAAAWPPPAPPIRAYSAIPWRPRTFWAPPPARASVQRYLGMMWLAKLLYPDATAQYDMYNDAHEYYELFYHCDLTRAQYDALVANSLGK